MNIHKNTRTTSHIRGLIVSRVLGQNLSPRRVAEELGISLRTVYKWLSRYRSEGPSGLRNRSSTARRIPHRLPPAVAELIAKLRREFRITARRIAEQLRLARSTVAVVLQRLGLNRLKLLEPKVPILRYEPKSFGELIHLDIKKLGPIRGIGHPITGNRHKRARGIGWKFAHVGINDHSRLAYVEVLPDERKESALGFLKRAVVWFAGKGVKVQRIMTDNGSCGNSKVFAAACRAHGPRHIRTRPYTPKTNEKAERFIQNFIRKWAYGGAYQSSNQPTGYLPPWLDYYIRRREHGGIGFQPPITRIATASE